MVNHDEEHWTNPNKWELIKKNQNERFVFIISSFRMMTTCRPKKKGSFSFSFFSRMRKKNKDYFLPFLLPKRRRRGKKDSCGFFSKGFFLYGKKTACVRGRKSRFFFLSSDIQQFREQISRALSYQVMLLHHVTILH
jgi:hypothetical protein